MGCGCGGVGVGWGSGARWRCTRSQTRHSIRGMDTDDFEGELPHEGDHLEEGIDAEGGQRRQLSARGPCIVLEDSTDADLVIPPQRVPNSPLAVLSAAAGSLAARPVAAGAAGPELSAASLRGGGWLHCWRSVGVVPEDRNRLVEGRHLNLA